MKYIQTGALMVFTFLAFTPVALLAANHAADQPADASVEARAEAGASSDVRTEAGAQADVDAQDADDDGDALPERADASANARGSARATTTGTSSESTQRGKAMDKSTPKLYQGFTAEVCTRDGDCDDADEAARPGSDEFVRIRVDGNAVRGWTEEQKQEARMAADSDVRATSSQAFGLRVAAAAMDNEDVREIVSEEDHTEVRYRTRMRLFGFIPFSGSASARVSADGQTEVDYPWYGALSSKSDESETFLNLAEQIRADYEAAMGIAVEEEGAPANRREDTEE